VDPNTAKLIEFALVFGGVLGIAIWQWVSVRRELRRDDERERAADEERRRPPGA
jgi:hypothetical protein